MGEFPVQTTGITEAPQETNADSVQELDAITPALEQPEETQDAEVSTLKLNITFLSFYLKAASTTPQLESTTEMDTTTTEEPYYADEKAHDGEYDEDEYDEGIVEDNNIFIILL